MVLEIGEIPYHISCQSFSLIMETLKQCDRELVKTALFASLLVPSVAFLDRIFAILTFLPVLFQTVSNNSAVENPTGSDGKTQS